MPGQVDGFQVPEQRIGSINNRCEVNRAMWSNKTDIWDFVFALLTD